MLIVLSPSKTLDYETRYALKDHTQPAFLKDSAQLVAKLKAMSEARLAAMMEISPKLASLNAQRFRDFHVPFTQDNARQALLAFKGDVYEGIEVEKYSAKDFAFAQVHVRILSGLYALLRPLDLMQPYRLEMGRKLSVGKTKDLYSFWGARIAIALDAELAAHKQQYLINLASEEYAKAVVRTALSHPVIDVAFKEKKNGQLKIVALFAKKARGMMANYVVRERIDTLQGLKDFREGGYRFEPKLSTDSHYVFVR